MKLYVLFNQKNNKIIALSEDKAIIYQYIIQQNFNEDYKISKIKRDNLISKFLILYDELILQKFDEFILTSFEANIINKTIDEEKCKIEDTIDSLSFMIKNYNFSSKDQKVLLNTLKILNKNIKPKRLSILIRLKEFIYSIIYPHGNNIIDVFKDEINAKDNWYFIDINLNERNETK
jgi:hypothetical protein